MLYILIMINYKKLIINMLIVLLVIHYNQFVLIHINIV